MNKLSGNKPAKTCYDHIGGKLGSLLFKQFIDKGWIKKNKNTDKHYYITEQGEKEFTKLGIDLAEIKPEKS